MRDPAGNVGPGGPPLVAKLVGDVVESQHVPVAVAHSLHRQRPLSFGGMDQHIGFSGFAGHEFAKLGRNFEQLASLDPVFAPGQQRVGGAVGKQDAAIDIERNNAGGHARQHGFHEGAPRIELLVGRHQRAGLFL